MKNLGVIIISIVLMLSLGGCGNTDPTDATDTKYVGSEEKIINLQMREPDTLDILSTQRQSVRDALLCVYEPLFNITSDFAPENVLAENYAFNESATVMTLKIKEGVYWHNNKVFSAEDVVYTVNRIKSMPQSSYYANLESVDRVEKLSDYEVVFYLNKSNVLLPYSLYFPIVRTGAESGELIGTGAYMLEKTDGKSISLVKNGAWHMGEAKADGVKFLYMRTKEMAQEAFSSGKIHAVTKEMLDVENFAIKEENSLHLYPDGLFEFVGFNAEEGIFKDSLLRIGASSGINRAKIGEIFTNAVASGFPIMPGSSLFSPSYEMSEYNLDYAKEVVFSAGWVDTDGDGVCEKAIDNILEELEFDLLVADSDKLRGEAAEEIKEQLALSGFRVNVVRLELEEYERRIAAGEYDAFLGAVYYADAYDVSDILASYGNLNFSGYESSEMDNVIGEMFRATTAQKASAAFAALQAIYTESMPIAGLIFRRTYVVASPYIEGDIEPYPYSPYANIAKWNLVGLDTEEEIYE